jgi:ethanolamine ammonia-lyase large subunit
MDPRELRRCFALASAFKEGDLAVGGTRDDRLRADARRALGALTVREVQRTLLIDDGVTAALDRSRDRRFDDDLGSLTIGRLKDIMLAPGAEAWARRFGDGLASEVVAAVVKVMTDDELSVVARTLFNPLAGAGVAIGAPSHFGSRIQPNSPGDDEQEILFSILEGLSYGCGDVIIGLNPAADDVDTIIRLEQLLEQVVRRLELPTRFCVLSDILKQDAARRHTRVDVAFQSLAGTSRALTGMVGLDVPGLLDLVRGFDALYFETGQGSEVTNGAAEGVDMVTLEARTYGVARHLRRESGIGWMIVNDVAGFIGPEVFCNGRQLERTCLEDVVMAKLHGLTMGLDVCATFHMGIAPAELRRLTERIVQRTAPAYLMAVAGNADPMLGYLTTSFREHSQLRSLVGRGLTSPMQQRLIDLGVATREAERSSHAESVAQLYAAYVKAGGSRQSVSSLMEESREGQQTLRERGFDIGIANGEAANARVDAIYAHARTALYAAVDDGVVRDSASRPLRVRTAATSRDEYLAHPSAGERLRDEDAARITSLSSQAPHVQLVISDGLNANAINQQLRVLLPALRHALSDSGHHVGEHDVVVQNGRVRVGYEIGGLVRAAIVVHVIGERPGTGLNSASIYVTYGRDETGQSRWSRSLDHSVTNAVCGIHPRGKPAATAVAEVGRLITRMTEERRSGVVLQHAAATEAKLAETITARNKNESARQANRRVEVLIKGVDLTVPTPQETKPSS